MVLAAVAGSAGSSCWCGIGRYVGASFAFLNTLQSHPAVILYVYLLPKSTFQTLSTTSGVFCDLYKAPAQFFSLKG
jgi:hypothetical protein